MHENLLRFCTLHAKNTNKSHRYRTHGIDHGETNTKYIATMLGTQITCIQYNINQQWNDLLSSDTNKMPNSGGGEEGVCVDNAAWPLNDIRNDFINIMIHRWIYPACNCGWLNTWTYSFGWRDGQWERERESRRWGIGGYAHHRYQ